MGLNGFLEWLVSSSIPEEQVTSMVIEIVWLRREHTSESYRRIGGLVGVCYYKYHKKNLSEEQQREMAKQHALELGLEYGLYDTPYMERPFLPDFLQGWLRGYQMLQMNS